jgi:hypothetical protein
MKRPVFITASIQERGSAVSLYVVVKVVPDDAFVLTAYLTDKAKKGTVLWNAST